MLKTSSILCMLLLVAAVVPVQAADKTGTVFSTTDPQIVAALKSINQYRKQAGLKPVTLSEKLSKGCYQHSKYVVLNRSGEKGLSGHYEEDNMPYATPEGKEAGLSSCIAYVNPEWAIKQFMATFYHRMPLIDPNTVSVGIGYYTDGSYTVCCVDMRNDWQWNNDVNTKVVVYPAENNFDVTRDFQNERPNPIPDSIENPGYPITLQFFKMGAIKDVQVLVTDGQGRKVECMLSTPEAPLTDFPQNNIVCIIPVNPLNYNTTYTVNFSCTLDGKPFRKKWDFFTLLYIGG